MRVVRAPCMGACDRAPVCAVGHVQVMQADAAKVAAAAATAAARARLSTPTAFDAYCAPAAMAAQGLPAGARTRDDIIKVVSDAGLRGLGGAGFPTGRKWRWCAPSRRRG